MNEFDKILRETFEGIVLKAKGTGTLPFSLEYKVVASLFTANLLKTLERRIDFAKVVVDRQEIMKVLQLEFQTKSERRMVARMQTYRALIHEWYDLPVVQYVIYLGETPATMATHIQELIPHDPINYHFELIEIRNFDASQLMASDIPEIIILAILGARGTADPFDVAASIIKRLKVVCENETELEKYIVQLQTISKLRNLDNLFIERREDMALETGISMMDVAWYREAYTSGAEKARKEAKQATMNAALKMLQSGKLSDEDVLSFAGITKVELDSLKGQLSK